MKHFSRAAIVIAVGTAWPAMAGVPATTTSTLSTVTSTTTSTSTTTTPPPACTDAATFDSILCRLDEQSALVQTTPELGKAATKLAGALNKATSGTTKASDACDTGDTKAAGKQLKKAIRRMIQYNHRLGSLKSRKTIPDEVRTPFLDAGRGIQNDMQSLKKNLTCPPPGSPSPAFL
jgi:hypothetical protein